MGRKLPEGLESKIQPRSPGKQESSPGEAEEARIQSGTLQEDRIPPQRLACPYRRALALKRPCFRRGARKNNALRKKWSEWYIAKENRPKGALVRKLIFLQPLRPKGYMAKGRKYCKTRLKLKSSSFLSEGYIDKGLFRKGISIRNFRRVYR